MRFAASGKVRRIRVRAVLGRIGRWTLAGVVLCLEDSIVTQRTAPESTGLHGAASPTYTASIRGTERPTFATDDLLSELTAGGATVRATSIVQQRGFLTNLLISFAPILL